MNQTQASRHAPISEANFDKSMLPPETTATILRWPAAARRGERAAATAHAAATGGIDELDADTKVSSASWDAALGSVGGAITAVRGVAQGTWANAFVATRPPGHHATPERAMGFCLFNNVAVAARWLQAAGHADKVAIVDWDVHHGNGTEACVSGDDSVLFVSLHQWPFYPGTGGPEEQGETLLNIPLGAGTGDHYLAWRLGRSPLHDGGGSLIRRRLTN